MPNVNPEILRWARETAGLSIADAAKAIGLSDTKKATGTQKLELLEAGESQPSRSQLQRMAERYRRPLIAFYLREPPKSADRGEDFRRAAGAPPIDFDPKLDALIRTVRVRHDLVKTLLEDEEVEPLGFVGSSTRADGVRAVLDSISGTIGFDLEAFRRERTVGGAFGYLRRRLEGAGIFVMLVGDLGSYHSKISSDIFRGYAIADVIAPFIVINDNDANAAWAFTALHETAHIWLGQTGLSGQSDATRIERFCNEVAGSLLVPRDDLQALGDLSMLGLEQQLERISQSAAMFNVSRRMVAYRLMRGGTVDRERYEQLIARFHADWLHSKTSDRDKLRNGRGPNPHVIKRHRLGPAIVNLAQRAVASGALSPTKASKLLGVKAGAVHALLGMRSV